MVDQARLAQTAGVSLLFVCLSRSCRFPYIKISFADGFVLPAVRPSKTFHGPEFGIWGCKFTDRDEPVSDPPAFTIDMPSTLSLTICAIWCTATVRSRANWYCGWRSNGAVWSRRNHACSLAFGNRQLVQSLQPGTASLPRKFLALWCIANDGSSEI